MPPIAALLLAGPTLGTTFVLMNEENLAASASAALIGTVTAVDPALDIDDGSVHTQVSIAPDVILFGELNTEKVVLRELGGEIPGRRERVYGVPRYVVGETALVFVSQADDGTLHTTAMAMGKYRLSAGRDGGVRAARTLDEGSVVLDPQSGALETTFPSSDLFELLERVGQVRSIHLPAEISLPEEALEASEPFTYLGDASRWFEPDEGVDVEFLVCPPEGDHAQSSEARQAVAEAFEAWSSDPLSSLSLAEGSMDEPMPFQSCSGPNRIVFDDPFDEVDDPSGCSGVLAIGGYCAIDHETREINGQSFRRIRVGRVTFGDGWSNCPTWNACNMAEVATHEVGHAIGLGHSTVKDATMAPAVHFDGRCAELAGDDLAGLRSLYPRDVVWLSPTPSRTPTDRPTPTERTTPTATPSATKRPTRTPRAERTEGGSTPPPTPSGEEPTVGVAETPSPGPTPVDAGMCAGDTDGDRQVSIDELITVLLNSLHGCEPSE